jgi:N-acetylneuraminate synthase
MCLEKDIEKAVEIFREAKCPFLLMHTVSVYPCEEDQLNLLYIKILREKFKMNVGYSGHEPSVSPSLAAAALGAKVIERHITLNRSMYGSDQSASLEPDGLRRLVAGLRKYPGILGNGIKTFGEKESQVARKLRYWE